MASQARDGEAALALVCAGSRGCKLRAVYVATPLAGRDKEEKEGARGGGGRLRALKPPCTGVTSPDESNEEEVCHGLEVGNPCL